MENPTTPNQSQNLIQNSIPPVPVPPTQQVVPTPAKSNNQLLTIVILIVIILLFALGATGFFAYQNMQLKQQISQIQPTPTTISTIIKPNIQNNISFLRGGNIWLADKDGANQKQVTTEGKIIDFYWVPNANKIVFISESTDSKKEIQINVKLLNLDNNNEQVIHTRIDSSRYGLREYKLGISPDGKKIALSGDLVDKNLIIHDIDSGTEKEITAAGVQPFFSSDGHFLAGIDNGNIFTYSINNDAINKLTNFTDSTTVYKQMSISQYAAYESPKDVIDWLHNSNRIMYYFGDSGQGGFSFNSTYHINGIDINSKSDQKFTQSGLGELDTYYDQSADGKYIYFKVNKNILIDPSGLPADPSKVANLSGYQQSQQGYGGKSTETLLKEDVDTKQVTVIPVSQQVPSGPSVDSLNIMALQVSPINNSLVYEWAPLTTATNSNPNHEIWQMNPDGTNNHKIIDDASDSKWEK